MIGRQIVSNTQIIELLIVSLVASCFVLSLLLHKGKKQIEEKQKYTIFLVGKTHIKGSRYYELYDFFSNWFLTRSYVSKISRNFEFIMPGDKLGVKKQSMQTAFIIWTLDVAMFILLFIFSPGLFGAIVTITYIYIVNNQVLFLILKSKKTNLLEQTEEAVGEIKSYYQEHGIIEEAIEQTAERSDYLIKLHLLKMANVINCDDKQLEEEVSKYEEAAPNRFLKILLSLSVMVKRYGDKKVDGKGVFQTNLRYLRKEINIEITNKKREQWLFTGFLGVCIVPILFIEPVKKWAVSSFAESAKFYNGAYGLTIVILIFLATIFSYNLILRLQDNTDTRGSRNIIFNWILQVRIIKKFLDYVLNKNYGHTLRTEKLLKISGERLSSKEFLLKRCLMGILTFIFFVTLTQLSHVREKSLVLNESTLNYSGSMFSEKQEAEIKELIQQFVYEWKDISLTAEEVRYRLQEQDINKGEVLELMVNEILHRVHKYQNEYYKWYELLIAASISLIGFYIPYLKALLLKKIRKMDMDDEIIQFHSIILMLMNLDHVSIETILLWFEKFSNIFKESIQECINNLSFGDIEALELLKEREPYEPFVRIISNLQLCDKVSLDKAFDEVNEERYNYHENRKLDNEIYLKNKTIIAEILAWLPAFLLLFIYLTLPWIVLAFQYLFNQLNQMKNFL